MEARAGANDDASENGLTSLVGRSSGRRGGERKRREAT